MQATYTTVRRLKIIKTFLMFLKEISYVHQACIYLIKNTTKNSTIVKYYSNNMYLFYN